MDNFENLECISLILEIWKYISYFPKFGKYNAGRAIFGGYISWAAYCCHGKWRRKINTNGWDGSSIDVTSLGQAPDSGVACPGIVPRSEGAALGYEHNLTKSSMWAIILTNPLYSNIVWMASSMWCSVGATFRLGSHLSQYIHLSRRDRWIINV